MKNINWNDPVLFYQQTTVKYKINGMADDFILILLSLIHDSLSSWTTNIVVSYLQ